MDDTSHPEDRFRRIEGLYHQALKMPAEERPGFFARACAGEDDLRREVEKLLAFDRKAGSYMESPALDVAAHALAQEAGPGRRTSFTGQTILHYRVLEKIGEEQPFPLTSGPADDRSPAWSPDARYIAFLRQLSATKASIVLIPQRGGQERIVGESCVDTVSPLWRSYLAWTPDSNGLVFASAESAVPGLGLSLLSLETREKRKLTSPPEGTDTCPAVSPDGRTLAFTRMRGFASARTMSRKARQRSLLRWGSRGAPPQPGCRMEARSCSFQDPGLAAGFAALRRLSPQSPGG
jgi:hypothetical protein